MSSSSWVSRYVLLCVVVLLRICPFGCVVCGVCDSVVDVCSYMRACGRGFGELFLVSVISLCLCL